MEDGRPSTTAMLTASLRAVHFLFDDEPKILRDSLALGLSGAENEVALRASFETTQTDLARRFSPEFAQARFRYIRAFAVMRNHYAEDALSEALQRGVTQYVILGAGLDSFAYRRRDLADRVRVFEVDHPATQQWKRARLHELRVELPPNLTFIPFNFERHTLREGLQAGGYRLEAPAFFSWLGTLGYLTEEAIFATLREIATLARGSEVVFEYALSESLLDEETRTMLTSMKVSSAARGEPWLSFFEPATLTKRVQALGFSQIEDFGPEEANARYFTGRRDGLRLRVPSTAHLMKARVGSAT